MRKRNVYFTLLILVVITVANWHFAAMDVNTSGIALKGLIQTAFADIECDPPPYECPYGYYCDNGICKPYVSQQTQECSITDWCWCWDYNVYQWDFIQISCQGVKTACSPDPFGSTSCSYTTECSGCDPCTEGEAPFPYEWCQEEN